MYTISIRNSYDLKNLDLVELHGMLKTYELEMSQDIKIMNKKKSVEASNQSAAFFVPSTSTTDYTVTFPTEDGSQSKHFGGQGSSRDTRANKENNHTAAIATTQQKYLTGEEYEQSFQSE
ncbi:hypothetical protein L1987_60298 [Smallanthus sonchifolius]|uniref:Uncharacterized protein n=1 Tax=Smallanthus sonchifolius TaxID=185202 RepID=A0ACB9D829_9ASTR|nr:hypothetical protein L1987_60298 [Smallanthus sonchifolius]